jgi:hypothetical protein
MMNFRMMKPIVGASALAIATFVAPAQAQTSRADYDAAKTRAESDYKVARERCKPLRGNDQDVCEREAKAVRDKTIADANAAYKNTDRARANAAETKAEADYKVAREKCDALSGNQKDVCVEQARAAKTKAEAAANEQRRVSDARRDSAESKREADYRVARERCDSMSGAEKDRCLESARRLQPK